MIKIAIDTLRENQWVKNVPIILFLGLAAAIIICALQSNSIWLDEVFSLNPIGYSFLDMMKIQSHDVWPPMYWILGKIWSSVFGMSIISMKMFSVIPTILSSAILMRFLQKEFSNKVAVMFLLILGCSYPLVSYSFEIRGYILGYSFVSMLIPSAYYIIKTGHSKWWLMFGLFAVLSIWTHVYAAIAALLVFTVLLIYILLVDRAQIKKFTLTAILSAVLILPWAKFIFLSAGDVEKRFWIEKIGSVSDFIKFPLQNSGDYIFWMFGILIAFLAYRSIKNKNGSFSLAMISVPVMVFTAGIIISHLFRPLLVDRYMIPSLAFVFIFLAIAASQFRSKILSAIIAGILVISSCMNIFKIYGEEKKDMIGFSEFISFFEKNIKPKDALIFIENPNIQTISKLQQVQKIFDRLFTNIPQYRYIGNGELIKAKKPEWANGKNGHYLYFVFYNSEHNIEDLLEQSDTHKHAWVISDSEIVGNNLMKPIGMMEWKYYKFYVYETDFPKMLAKEIIIEKNN